ncbi:MAG: DUF3750 domain-containing protein [Parcubacteria group bacterium]
MGNDNCDDLIDPEKYEVFILRCPANVPLIFAVHPWFVCNEKGEISRWEVLFRANEDASWGHLHLNRHPPFSGIEIFPFLAKWQWHSRLMLKVEGEMAKKMIGFIKMSKENYPHLKNYSLCGTNSNTYAQWVLDNFAEIGATLPWNAFGKNAK